VPKYLLSLISIDAGVEEFVVQEILLF